MTTFTIRPATVVDANVDLVAATDSIADTWAAWRTAGTYTWKIDRMIEQICNALFSQMRKTYAEKNGIVALNEVSTLLAFELECAQAFQDAGFDRTGPVKNLHDLLCLRDEAYELEKELCSCANPDIETDKPRIDQITGAEYKPLFHKIDIEEFFLHYEPKVPNASERTRFEGELTAIAATSYEEDADREEFVRQELQVFDAAQLLECKQFNEGLERNAPVKQLILEQIMALGLEPIKFSYELETPVLQTLLHHVLSSVPRTKEWNRKRYGATAIEKALAVAELDKFARYIEGSLRAPRFNEGVPYVKPVRKQFRSLA